MRRTAPGLRTDLESRLAELERANPEWRPWLAMLREMARAHGSRAWSGATRVIDPENRSPPLTDAPLLHERTIVLRPKPFERLARRLAKAAAAVAGLGEPARSLQGFRPAGEDVCALVEAAIRPSPDALAARATTAGVDAGSLSSLAALLATTGLRICAEALAARRPRHWPHGYCPVCGAWPALAELRGMERARRLRCGRCGGDWQMVWLRCAFCGETDHERLGRLAPEGSLESRFVEACSTCGRYLKCSSTLTALTPMELLLRDLETVELDLAALDHGSRRPTGGQGFPVTVRVVAEG